MELKLLLHERVVGIGRDIGQQIFLAGTDDELVTARQRIDDRVSVNPDVRLGHFGLDSYLLGLFQNTAA